MSYSMRNAHNYAYLTCSRHKFKTLFNDDYRRIMDFFGVNRATAYRWIAAGQPTTNIGLKMLDIAASGFLPCVDNWNGYFIWNGRLVTPKGFEVSPGEIELMCEFFGREPNKTTEKLLSQPRNVKPWRDREPDFVKRFKS